MRQSILSISFITMCLMGITSLELKAQSDAEAVLSDFELITTAQGYFRQEGIKVKAEDFELKNVVNVGRVLYIYVYPSRNNVEQIVYTSFLVGGVVSTQAEKPLEKICIISTVRYGRDERTLFLAATGDVQELFKGTITWEEFLSYIVTSRT